MAKESTRCTLRVIRSGFSLAPFSRHDFYRKEERQLDFEEKISHRLSQYLRKLSR